MGRETASGALLPLSALSVGTRMQLLLALRVAFARQVERGCESLPFFIDEALATSDPERFRAVAQALNELARDDDRQVVYLTSQPEDVAAWMALGIPVNAIDLDAIRQGARGQTDWTSRSVEPAARVPAPDGMDAPTYAKMLNVPTIDPFAPVEAVHPFHILRDDLDILHRLLSIGLGTCGALEGFLRDPNLSGGFHSESRVMLSRRLRWLHSYLAAWRIGRGRLIEPGDLAVSPLSDTFRPRIEALIDPVGGDPRALMDALDERAVARFGQKPREDLRAWLYEKGFLDDRTVLDADGRLQRVIAECAVTQPPSVDEVEAIRTVIVEIEAGLAGIPEGASATRGALAVSR